MNLGTDASRSSPRYGAMTAQSRALWHEGWPKEGDEAEFELANGASIQGVVDTYTDRDVRLKDGRILRRRAIQAVTPLPPLLSAPEEDPPARLLYEVRPPEGPAEWFLALSSLGVFAGGLALLDVALGLHLEDLTAQEGLATLAALALIALGTRLAFFHRAPPQEDA